MINFTMKKFLSPKTYLTHLIYLLFLPKKSYAQAGEDIILDLFLNDQGEGFYVDIGANHPKRFSNTLFFYKRGWRGINIEPDSNNFRRFIRSRHRDINLNIGVAEATSVMDFYGFKSDTLSTFSKESAERYKAVGYELQDVKKIAVRPLKEILDEYLPTGGRLDFFSIDTEGLDKAVLKSNDWVKYRPKFVILETLEFKESDGTMGKKLGEAKENYLDSYMEGIGYFKMADTYVNSIYIEKGFAKERKMNIQA
jgi:FkbM family methyltransferase